MKAAESGHVSGMPPLLILAGGASSRFGSPKGLARWNGQTLLAAHIHSYADAGACVLVVTGHYSESYVEELGLIGAALAADGSKCRISWIRNPDPQRGPFSSIQTGLNQLGTLIGQGVFIQPVDTGPVAGSLYAEMAAVADAGRFSVLPVFAKKGGHPVLLATDLASRCARLDLAHPDSRLDVILRSEPAASIVRLPVRQPDILFNFNYPQDLSEESRLQPLA